MKPKATSPNKINKPDELLAMMTKKIGHKWLIWEIKSYHYRAHITGKVSE